MFKSLAFWASIVKFLVFKLVSESTKADVVSNNAEVLILDSAFLDFTNKSSVFSEFNPELFL